MSLGICFKKLHLVKVGALAWYIFKIGVIFVVRFERRKADIKQTYMKTETYRLYTRVFWVFLPNVIKIDPYNFELYDFKVGAFFWDTVYMLLTLSGVWSLSVSPVPPSSQTVPSMRTCKWRLSMTSCAITSRKHERVSTDWIPNNTFPSAQWRRQHPFVALSCNITEQIESQ